MRHPAHLATLLLTLAPATAAQDMLGVNAVGIAYGVDSADGGSVLAGWSGLSIGVALNALAVTPGGAAYGVGAYGELYLLDIPSGAATSLGPLAVTDLRGLAWDDANQQLLAIQAASLTAPCNLWRIDPGSLQAQLVGSTGHYVLQSLDMAPDGTLYSYENAFGGEGLVIIDPLTGASTDPFPGIDAQQDVQWLAVSPAGEVLVGHGDVFGVDLVTGAETLIGAISGGPMRGLDFVPGPPVTWPNSAFCFGDGSGAPCPCGNDSQTLTGCDNLDYVGGGAVLAGFGSASVSAADLSLRVVAELPFQSLMFFQGSAALGAGSGIPFGDGLRCVGGAVVRLEFVDGGISSFPMADTGIDIASVGAVAPGDVRYYQVWYPIHASQSACGTGFNLSNALRVDWLP